MLKLQSRFKELEKQMEMEKVTNLSFSYLMRLVRNIHKFIKFD